MKRIGSLCSILTVLVVVSCAVLGCGGSDTPPAPPVYPQAHASLSPNLSNYRVLEDTAVSVTFDRPVDVGTVTPDSVYVTQGEDASSPRVAGTLEVSPTAVTIKPISPLTFGVHYRAHATQGVKGADGQIYEWVFDDVGYGNTGAPAAGDILVVNIPKNLEDGTDGIMRGWPLLGYVPPVFSRDPQATDPSKPETVPGISATEAWKFTTGRPDVLVAVLDTGLSSYNVNGLIRNLFLNRGELPLPRDEAGAGICDLVDPCGDAYDFNRDGRFNIEDYQAAGYAIFPDGGLGPVGDANADGTIDPEDLFDNFMDGVKGYPADPDTAPDRGDLVDDISGYDFLRNEPRAIGLTDFPQGCHGQDRVTEVSWAPDVIGEKKQNPGVCPDCTFMIVRVTYALLEEGELVGHGIRYAVDMGADAIVSVLGALTGTADEVEALKVADDAGVPVVIGMSDEGSFHPTMPSVMNHVIATKCNMGFFVESPCTMYGVQTHLAACGPCGSSAGGHSAGAVGLLISRARELGYCQDSRPEDASCNEPDLTANEVKQILTLTAEKPADLAACRGMITEAPCKRTWDWHQGYGRMNLFQALLRLETAPLPPEVQILSPGWISVLNPELPTTKTLTARVRSRVPVDSVVCEWAPGIEPDDGEFRALDCVAKGDDTMEADLPLEDMAVSVGGLNHTPDKAYGKSVTVRIRASTGSVYGEDRRVLTLHGDPTWVPGFPISLIDNDKDGSEEISAAAENAPSIEASPAMADLNADGKDELVVVTSNAQLHVIKYAAAGPYEADGFPVNVEKPDSYSNNGFSAPAVGDLDKDGSPDIVVSTFAGEVYAFRGRDGSPLAGTDGMILEADPPSNESSNAFGAGNLFYGSPVLVDLDGDGYLDVLAGGGDQKVYAVAGKSIARGRPRRIPGWPVKPADPKACSEVGISIVGTIAVADLNEDGRPEVIVGTSEECKRPIEEFGRLYAIRPEGTLHPRGPFVRHFPVAIPANLFLGTLSELLGLGQPVLLPLPPLSTGVPGAPVAARNGDEVLIGASSMLGPPVIVHVNVPTGSVHVEYLTINPLGPFGEAGSGAFHRDASGRLFFSTGTGHLGRPGKHAILASIGHKIQVFRYMNGGMVPVMSKPISDYMFFMNPDFVDVNGDGETEVVVVSGSQFVDAFDFNGHEAAGWPKFTGDWHVASPAFGDMDGDGKLEMAAPVRFGRIFAWKTDAPLCGAHSWPTFHHDNHRTGNLDTLVIDERCEN